MSLLYSAKVPIYSRWRGYYLRWYYNGWHYWYFLPGQIIFDTQGEKYRTVGTRKVIIGTGQITESQVKAIRTIANTKEIYIYADSGWGVVRLEHNPIITYDHYTHGYEIELNITIGSNGVSKSGFSPAIILPEVPASYEYCELPCIDGQTWMCANYGSDYPGSLDINNDISNRATRGKLYSFNMVNSAGFCPTGWHVPTVAEWNKLAVAAGGSSVAGKLKETGTTYWDSPNTGANSEFGFNLRSTGYYDLVSHSFLLFGQQALMLTSDSYDATHCYYVEAEYNSDNLNIGHALKNQLLAVRLIKDNPCQNPLNYGALYNWYAANDVRNICAEGWSVPTKTEWETLFTYLGGKSIAGGKLKEIGFTYWNSPNTGATNEVGFNARAGGSRDYFDGTYNFINRITWIWTSSLNPPTYVNGQSASLSYNSEVAVSDINSSRCSGRSVRFFRPANASEQLLDDGEACDNYIGNDLKQYRTVKIGTQVWVADNIAETKYRDGSLIPEVTNNIAWSALNTGAWCAYNNDHDNI